MKLVGKPNAGNRPVLAGLPAHPSYHIKTWRSSTKGLRDTLSTLSGSGRTGRRRRFASSARIAVCQRLQEGDDVVDLLARQTRLVSDVPVERRLDIDVGLILRRQVVVLAHRAVGLARIPFLWMDIALDVEFEHLAQSAEDAIVKERAPQRDIAQAWPVFLRIKR